MDDITKMSYPEMLDETERLKMLAESLIERFTAIKEELNRRAAASARN